MRISGEEWGGITSNAEFENFEAVIVYKWGEKTYGNREGKARDSGFLFSSVGEDGGCFAWMPSLEVNILEGRVGDFVVAARDESDGFMILSTVKDNGELKEFKANGAAYELKDNRSGAICRKGVDPKWKDFSNAKDLNSVERPAGEWNTLKLIVNKGFIDVYLNGVLVNRAFNYSPRRGRIQIQSEGAEIFYKAIDIKIL